MAGFLGMRGTGDWATDERPYNWRQGILRLYPNGSAPLTAILSKMGEQSVDDAQFHWWTKSLAAQAGAVTNIYTEATLTTAYVSGGTSGQTLYVNVAEAVADEFRVGHVALLRYSSDPTVDCIGKVTDVVKNGASSYMSVKLLEADDNSSSYDLSDCDRILIVGNVNSEGAGRPDAIAYDPTKWYNYTQIFRTPLDITRTAKKTRLRTADAYKEAKREALELHSIEMEKAFLWGIRSENTGANGKPERTTFGLIPAIRDGASGNIFDYISDSDYSGQTWVQGGEDWLDAKLEQVFRYGSQEKLAFAGSGALLGINRLAKTYGQINLQPKTKAYGIKVVEWITPFGVIYLKTHPLFSYETTDRNSMVVFEPAMLKYKYIDDTKFIGQKGDMTPTGVDGTEEEYLTEAGLEYHHPSKFGYFTGLNSANTA
jgi:hypothetical protein